MIPFARTLEQRRANHDPRPSLEERYGSHDGYVGCGGADRRGGKKRGAALTRKRQVFAVRGLSRQRQLRLKESNDVLQTTDGIRRQVNP